MAVAAEPNNEILRSLPPEILEQFRPRLRLIKLAVGQVLYEPGDDVDRVYFPESGLISLVTPMRDGHDVENTSRGRDGGIGYVEACGSEMMVSRAVVQIKGEAWCLAACDYRDAYEASGAMRNLIQRRTEILLADARQASACRAVHPASGRLGRTLLECYHHTGDLRLPLTQEFLAGMIGVGRTTVTHAAGRLQDLKLIRYSRGVVVISDMEGLKRHVCECYEVLREVRRDILNRNPHTDRAPRTASR
ncbi:MAG: Crp/Fnr family transcriptional regulator [Pseudomonadota bacterium]|nr:Crp/Fnr family transcriptional regulator [Pseudomonadota bacterium]